MSNDSYTAQRVVESAVQNNPDLLEKIQRAHERQAGNPSAVPAHEELSGDIVPAEDIITGVEGFITRYVVLPPHCGLTLAVWAVATYFYQEFEVFPYLHVTSPVRECGKTQLGQALCSVAANPIPLSGIPSEASLFRTVDSGQYTLVMDEIESLRNQRNDRAQAVHSILNSGYKKGAFVIRADGPKHETRRFATYCPKVLIGIGSIPDTVRSRSIVVPLRRKKAGETVGRFLARRYEKESEPLRKQLLELSHASKGEILEVYENLAEISELSDRDEEIWQPLFAVCAVLAPARLPELMKAALALSGSKAASDVDDSLPLRLLADIRELLDGCGETIPSVEMVTKLKGLAESPWSEPGRELTQNRLARMLRPFGVSSRDVRCGDSVMRGYLKTELQGAVALYVESQSTTGATTQ